MLRAVPIERLTALATRLLTRLLTRLEPPPSHPARKHIHTPVSLAAKAADIITGFVGSWLFVGIHAVWFIAWIIFHLEPFPYGLLTLLVSLEAIFLSTFVMMSQNRQAEKDHVRDDTEASEVEQLFQINQQQLTILQQQNEILALLKAHAEPIKHATKAKKETAAA